MNLHKELARKRVAPATQDAPPLVLEVPLGQKVCFLGKLLQGIKQKVASPSFFIQFNQKFLEVQEPFYKKVPGRRRQHAAAPILHGLKIFLPQINISNKRGPAPQGARRSKNKLKINHKKGLTILPFSVIIYT
jgi:hypothetical protein